MKNQADTKSVHVISACSTWKFKRRSKSFQPLLNLMKPPFHLKELIKKNQTTQLPVDGKIQNLNEHCSRLWTASTFLA